MGAPPCLTAAEDFGYQVEEAEVVFWGRCPECVAATPSERQDLPEREESA